MRWTRWIALIATVSTLGVALFVASCSTPSAQKPEMTREQLIARGEVISWSSGCQDCHTPGTFYGVPDTTRQLSGSELGWQGPWGVSYPRNLTPDSTGLATWTEDQIIAAFRTGHRPDGSVLLPPMPWPAYSRMSDDDARALAAFIKSLPPVKHVPPSVLPPGAQVSGPVLVFPPPPAWDAQNLPLSAEGGTPPPGGTQ